MQIKFHLTAALADYVASVLEQDAGGEINELGKLSETEHFSKTYVLPGGYQWETEPKLQDKEDVLIAAAQIETATDVDDETKQSELTALIDRAGAAGIDITVKELTTWLAEHEPEIPSYSWVQLNDFRLFELQDRCYPWLTTDELREQTDELPGPARPKWEQSATHR